MSNGCCGCALEDEKLEKIRDVIKNVNGDKSQLIHVLNEVQELYGYIPTHVQKVISEELDIPMAEIYGVITFYSRFSLEAKGKYNISVCLGTACFFFEIFKALFHKGIILAHGVNLLFSPKSLYKIIIVHKFQYFNTKLNKIIYILNIIYYLSYI